MLLRGYINKNYGGNQAAFARACGVLPTQVTKWITKNYLVIDGVLCKPQRKLPRI